MEHDTGLDIESDFNDFKWYVLTEITSMKQNFTNILDKYLDKNIW